MEIKRDSMCFACGENNPISLGLNFNFTDENEVEAEFIPGEVHQGYDHIMHGGLVSTLLDESMAKVIYMKGIKAVTAEMKTRFKKPVTIGEKLKVTGILSNRNGKLIYTESYLRNESGEIVARAEAKFIEIKD